jgi:hypothetical protein
MANFSHSKVVVPTFIFCNICALQHSHQHFFIVSSLYVGIQRYQLIIDMGLDARRRLQLFAANFEQRLNNGSNNNASNAAAVSSSLQEAHGAAAERRGLLDGDGDDEDMIEFETRKKSD